MWEGCGYCRFLLNGVLPFELVRSQAIKGAAEVSLNRQLVLYDPPRVLQPLHERERRVCFGGREWVIQQHWESVGVAAVIWEAVSRARGVSSQSLATPVG